MKKKKLIVLLMSLVMLFSVGCDNANIPGGGTKGGIVNVNIFEASFGTKWLETIAKEYKAATGVTVKVNVSYQGGEIISLLNSNQQKNDIVMPLGGICASVDQKKLEDITSVYDSTPDGETKKIKEKMNQNIQKENQRNGKYYLMNWVNSVSGLCYNKTMLDSKLGEGKWSIPRTTDEFFALADRVKATQNSYAVSMCAGINYYNDYLGYVWWAQYDGYDDYFDYYNGYYRDANGERKFGDNTGIISDTKGREESLKLMSRLLKSENGYAHEDAKDMSYHDASAAFVGQGFGKNKNECAFIVSGDWLENEVQGYLSQKPQDIRMMRAPVVSALKNKLVTIKDDATLSKVVDAVDKHLTSVDGVSKEDFNHVSEARRMAYSATYNHSIGVVASRPEKQKALAKDFLVFLASDYAQSIYAKQLNGLTMPFGYKPDTTSLTNFTRSRIENFDNDFVPIMEGGNSPMVYRGGLGAYMGLGQTPLDALMYDGKSPASILEAAKTSIATMWSILVDSI